MKEAITRFVSWMALPVFAGVTLGCASAPPGGAPLHQESKITATSATPTYSISTHPGIGKPRRFFLTKYGASWSLSFSPMDIANKDVERFLYWPSERLVTFDFSKGQPNRVDGVIFCHGKNSQTRTGPTDYTPCNSNFKVAESIIAIRVFSGILSAGMSELNARTNGTETFKLDKTALLTALLEQKIDKKASQFDYQEGFASLNSKRSIEAFISKYSEDDPDGLALKARKRLKEIEANELTLTAARNAVGNMDMYIKKYTPTHPEKYCKSFSRNQESMSICRSMVVSQVSAMARARAEQAYRGDVCKKIASSVGEINVGDLCTKYLKTGHCQSHSPRGKQVCDVLGSRG
jgi:hypothetical protein